MTNEREPVIIQVSKKMVIDLNISFVCNILNSFIPKLLDRNRNRVRLEVLGYGLDERELYDIPEVRLFFKKLFDDVDGAFYWLDPNSYMLILWGLMLFPPHRVNGMVGLAPDDLKKYLTWGYIKLNRFCQINNISPEPSNQRNWRSIHVNRVDSLEIFARKGKYCEHL
ncbi:MAG: hypothetical protein ACOX8O_02820 [Christensenellales bacterium]